MKAEHFAKNATAVLQAADAEEAMTLAGFLMDGHPVLTTLVLMKLRLIGLPEDLAEAYVRASKEEDSRTLDERVEDILKWARGHVADKPAKPAKKIGNEQALMTVIAIWGQRIRYGGAPETEAKDYAVVLLGAAQMPEDAKYKAQVANAILSLLDRNEVRKHVNIGSTFVVSEEDAKGILGGLSDWLAANCPYLYFHPKERRLKLDANAAESKTPSSEYRTKHPWGKDEGPHKTDQKKTFVR
jgi:hypothetical protein